MTARGSTARLHEVCDAARRVIQAGVATAAIVNDDNTVGDLVAPGLNDDVLGDLRRSIEHDSSHPARALRNGQKVIRGVNPGGDPASIGLPASHPPVHSYLFAPIASPSHVYGYISVAEKQGRPAFSDEDTEVISMLGALAGLAYENAELHSEAEVGLQLRQAQKMEALGQLAGGVAHDFNNLLTAITGYGRFALASATDPSQRRSIENIVTAADRATALTQRLLAFGRRQSIDVAVCDLNLLVSDMVHRLLPVVGEHIDLTTSLAADSARVRGNPGQLEQVVMNLVTNARDACSPGGQIHLATASIEVGDPFQSVIPGINPGLYVTLSVADDGCGMDEATRARLFEPFFTTKPRERGTGLGLASVYGIVVQSGGGIQVESEPGRGSTFTVYFPRLHEMSLPPERPIDSPADATSLNVLLVEDDQAVRELVRMMLERAGHRVVEAASAEEGITQLDAMSPVDLVVTDVVMPGMSGFDLFQSIVERRPSLRVLFISGYTDYAPFDETIARKRVAFLEKPFSARGLTDKIRELFDD